jgi:hypothetical protein
MRSTDDEMDWADVAAVGMLARKLGMTPREWLAQLDMFGLNNICAYGIREGARVVREGELIARAEVAERLVEAARGSLFWLADFMTEHAYQEMASALEAPPRFLSREEERTLVIDEWKASNGYDDLLSAYSTTISELARLHKLFDDAGQGEHNVLALVDHYQHNSMYAEERLRAVRKVLDEHGCDCPCGHLHNEHTPDCERCLACLVGEAVEA